MSSTRSVVQFQEDEAKFSGKYRKSVFETLFFAYRDVLPSFVAFFFVGLVGRVLILFNANLIGYWVDQLSGAGKQLPSFVMGWGSTQYVQAMLVFTILGLIFTLIFRIGFSRLSARAVSGLYDETTMRTSRYPLSFFDATPVGRVITRFSSDYGNIFRMFGGPLAEFINILFDLVAMLVLAVSASRYFSIIAIAMVAVYTLIYRLNRHGLRVARRESSRARSPAIAHFAETAQGAAIIRAFSRESIFSGRFQKLNMNYLAQRMKTIRRVIIFSFEMNAVSALLVVGTGLGGYALIQEGRLSVGELTVAFSFLLLASASLQMFFEWMSQFEEALVGVERMDEYLRRPLEPGLRLPYNRKYPTPHPVELSGGQGNLGNSERGRVSATVDATHDERGEVKIEDLIFRYRSDLPLVLHNLSVTVHAKEKLGIVGRTGSGKSTVVQCLYHLYPYESGSIRINGRIPQLDTSRLARSDEIPLTEFRKQMALISQESILFKGPLRDNLDMERRFTDQELWSVLDRVGLGSIIRTREKKLNTIVDERGRNLSMGERQLICIARCLLQNAAVVVMDEPTSSIDPQTEAVLMLATRELFADRTQIIIAHRLSTLEMCDRILWLKNGFVHMLGKTTDVLPLFLVDQQLDEQGLKV